MSISCGEPLVLEFEVDCPGAQASATADFVLYSLFDVPVVGGSSKVQRICGAGSSSRWQVTCALGSIPLNAGTYYASIWFGNQERDYASFSRALSIHVESADPFGWGTRYQKLGGIFIGSRSGSFRLMTLVLRTSLPSPRQKTVAVWARQKTSQPGRQGCRDPKPSAASH